MNLLLKISRFFHNLQDLVPEKLQIDTEDTAKNILL